MNNLASSWAMLGDKPVLLGSQCQACKCIQFPAMTVCPKCGPGNLVKKHQLSRTGLLYAFTALHQSKPVFPTPYFMGYVDLPEGVRVPGRIVVEAGQSLHCQTLVELGSGALGTDAAGQTVLAYVFRPVRVQSDLKGEIK